MSQKHNEQVFKKVSKLIDYLTMRVNNEKGKEALNKMKSKVRMRMLPKMLSGQSQSKVGTSLTIQMGKANIEKQQLFR